MEKIILGVSGSIAAYRTPDLVRGLVKEGHEVVVVLTQGGRQFVNHQVYSYLGAKAVFLPEDDFRPEAMKNWSASTQVLHIDLARWCTRIAVAPCSANTLSRMARCEANDLLSSIVLAKGERPLLIYPAMNPAMWENPFVQSHIETLKEKIGAFVHPPTEGEMVCGEMGTGKMPSIDSMIDTIPLVSAGKAPSPKKILISTGASVSPLDPVRYLTNPSTGITGLYLAVEALKQGHQVTVIHGPQTVARLQHLKFVPGATLVKANTTEEFKNAVAQFWPTHDIYISPAALGDFSFVQTDQEKIKKNNLIQNQKGLLEISLAPDVLQFALEHRKPHQKVIGFAAETKLTKEVLEEKMARKPVDLLVGTLVHSGQHHSSNRLGFGNEFANYGLYEKGQPILEQALTKKELATKLIDKVNTWLN